uniref:Uncharacterized protein n=1 Tax=Panagrolaimus sp. JU765 TaxID=591449 RepID=A0AC34QCB4_9BILA
MLNAESTGPLGSAGSFEYFDKIKEVCVETALKHGFMLHRQKIIVANAGSSAVYGKKNGVLLTPQLMFSSVLTHEMVHSFFIGHSYSDRKIKIFPYAMQGEYDDRYDLQSTANAYMHRSAFGMSGPGLNGAHLDFLGWLPMDRMLYFGRDGRQNYTVRLSSLSVGHGDTRGWLLIMIPYDRSDPRNFYTVEMRTPARYDKGIAQPAVLIHRVQRAGSSYYSVLISQSKYFYELTEGTEWVTFLEPDAFGSFQIIRISVKKLYNSDADVHVTSTFDPSVCRLGEIKKTVMDPKFGVGFVCVKRDRLHLGIHESDLRRQYEYSNFFGLRVTYGANECQDGFVWRAIDEYDFVCVPPHRQETAQSQSEFQADRLQLIAVESRESRAIDDVLGNSTVAETTNSTSSEVEEHRPMKVECLHPYVKRDAFVGDVICVTEREQSLTIQENSESVNFLKHYEFFNGVDTVGP